MSDKDFSYSEGIRRGGDKSTSGRFVSKEAVERYASIYGIEAARERFGISDSEKSEELDESDVEKESKFKKKLKEYKEKLKQKYKEYKYKRKINKSYKGRSSSIIMNSSNSTDTENNFMLGILMIVTVLVHFFDFRFNFQVDFTSIIVRAFVYFTISLAAYLLIQDDKINLLREVILVSSFPVIIIPAVTWASTLIGLPDGFTQPFMTFAFFVPVWPLYLILYKQIKIPVLSFIVKFYSVMIILAGIVYLLSIVIQTSAVEDLSRVPDTYFDADEAIRYFRDEIIIGPITSTWERLTSFDYRGSIEERLNQTLGRDYQGNVVRLRDQTGIFIDPIVIRGQYFEGDTVNFQVPIRVRTFEENRRINFYFDCMARDTRNQEIPGILSTKDMTLRDFEQDSVFCSFENVSRGRYNVNFRARFNFSTTGYSLFYFIDSDVLMQSHAGSEFEAARFFRIRNLPYTEYTQGPVSVGMNRSSTLPIPLRSDRDTSFTLSYGVQNANLREGDILRINSFEMSIPDEIIIEEDKCNIPFELREVANVTGYTRYRFVPETRGVVLELSCQARIPREATSSLVTSSFNEISEVTILTRVNYEYSLLRRTSFDVRS